MLLFGGVGVKLVSTSLKLGVISPKKLHSLCSEMI